MKDPFASAPADEAQAEPTPEPTFDQLPAEPPADPAPAPAKKAPAKAAPKVATAAPEEGKVVISLKGTGEPPWITIHASDMQDAYEQVSGENAQLLAKTMERAQQATQHFAGLAPASSVVSSAPRQPAPAAAQQPPGGSPACPGEGWVYKTGVSKSGPKAGQAWQAWMPPDAAKAAGAKPVWF